MEVLAESPVVLTVITFALVLLILASGIWIGIGLGLVGLILFTVFVAGDTTKMQGVLQFNIMDSFTLCAVPLFIFMGEIFMRSGIANKLYRGVTPWVAFLPGRLLHTNILSCAVFAAVSGSSLATAATIGTAALPELLEKRNYDPRLVLGSLAAGGTLGILIPPSICMILYGAWTNQSIGALFIAGVFPGILLTALFCGYIALRCSIQPALNPPKENISLNSLIRSLPDLVPTTLLIIAVLGSIYGGIATPTEAAALGVFIAMLLALVSKKLTWNIVKESGFGAVGTTAMISLIMVCAQMMSMALSMLRLPSELASVIQSLEMNRWVVMVSIWILYIILGCFLEALSMFLLTIGVIYPIVVALQFDPIWFGVILTVLIEMAQITPPVGINIFIIQGISGRRLSDVASGIIPFFFCQLVLLVILALFPGLATWLPSQMTNR
jgi:C4-dicarboxylate transporter, DctM subunit